MSYLLCGPNANDTHKHNRHTNCIGRWVLMLLGIISESKQSNYLCNAYEYANREFFVNIGLMPIISRKPL